MRRIIGGVLVAALLFLMVAPAWGQAFPVNLTFGASIPMPIGQTSTVAVTVKNTSNTTVQLVFLGLRFEWSGPNAFFIGGNSEKGAVLASGQQIVYSIPVAVPGNVTPGIHRLSAYQSFRTFTSGNWTGVNAGWWVADIQFSYPPTQAQPQPTTAGQAPLSSTTDLETIGIIIAVVAIGLFLERNRIGRLAKRKPKETGTQPPTAGPQKPPEATAPPTEEEEDL